MCSHKAVDVPERGVTSMRDGMREPCQVSSIDQIKRLGGQITIKCDLLTQEKEKGDGAFVQGTNDIQVYKGVALP